MEMCSWAARCWLYGVRGKCYNDSRENHFVRTPLEVRALQLGEERWRNGCWGSAEAAAANPADNVRVLPNLRGPGLLRVRPAPDEGMQLLLR